MQFLMALSYNQFFCYELVLNDIWIPLSTLYSGFSKVWYLDLVWNLDATLYNFTRYLT